MTAPRIPRRAALAKLAASAAWAAQEFRIASPGYRYEFPRDHFNHPDFRTEWWYYTGNLFTKQQRRFGYELTFFRQAVLRGAESRSAWEIDDIFLAHLALSDLDGKRFFHTERLNRRGPGLAGSSLDQRRIWNGNWHVNWGPDERQELQAVTGDFLLKLALEPRKPPVIQGENGISRKSAGEGQASHYISFTRMAASGRLDYRGESFEVTGLGWMDHEFFTNELAPGQQGWDWLYIQFEDNTELMLYRMRLKDGTADPYSSGTWVPASGPARHLQASEYRLTPGERWKSPETGAEYPVEWRVEVPSLGIDMRCTTDLRSQELVSRNQVGPSYWEGAMTFTGTRAGRPAKGTGYLEMTGYSGKVRFGEPDRKS